MSQINPHSQSLTDQSLLVERPTIILIDGHSLAFRSYYAFAKSGKGGLRTKTGIPTSVCFGFLKSLLEVMTAYHPQYLAIAFDLGLPTFRHEADDTYKADRVDTPEDFIIDLENLQELLSGLNLPIFTAPGYEADDILGTLAQRASSAGYIVKILTGDQDLFQLVDREKNIIVLRLGRDAFGRSGTGIAQEYGPEEVKEKLGIAPTQVVDYKALCGDPSDQIPGVKGIGEKTAVQLLTTYSSLDGIYGAIDQIKGAVKQKLINGKDSAYHSQYLAKIVVDIPLDIELADCYLQGFDSAALIPVLEKLEFKHFLKQINQLQQKFGGNVSVPPGEDNPVVPVKDQGKSLAALDNSAENPVSTGENSSSQVKNLDSSNNIQLELFSVETQQEIESLPLEMVNIPGNVPIKPQIIDTEEKLIKLVKILETCTDPNTPVAWDTETTNLKPRDAKLVGIGCCWGAGIEDVAYIPMNHKGEGNLEEQIVLARLRGILESPRYPKVLQNAKFDRLIFRCQGIKLDGVVFDTMLASYVINPEQTHNLADLSQRYLSGVESQSYESLNIPKGRNIADVDIATVANYCGMDVYPTFLLVSKLRAEIEHSDQLTEVLKLEIALEPVLAEMEYTGIRIDVAYLQELSQSWSAELQQLEQEAHQIAGEKFNLGSPKQLSRILFDQLKLPTSKSRKIKTGWSTDVVVLEKLQGEHPIIDVILKHRTYSKLKSTYVDALPEMVHPDTGRVHTDFNQTVTGTGRLSSSNPNLQNIPIRTDFSRRIRKAFLPESNWLLVSVDYSQIELRILAHLSQEPVLIDAYNQNQDVHTVTAKLLFEKDTITPDERRFGKTINFGVIYGMGAAKFARSVGTNQKEGKEFIDKFYQRYAQVFAYLERVKKEAIAQGYVETILGRRRYFNFESSTLRRLKNHQPEDINLNNLPHLGQNDAQLLRAAANAPIQGSSADIIKLAMVKLQEILPNYRARLLLQVHDELIFEIPPNEWDNLQPKIRSVMENAVELSIPLVVDIHVGQNWMETK